MASSQQPREGQISVGDLSFRTLSLGPSDGELVLFLHGFPQFAESWAQVLSIVAEAGYRAVAVDQRGYSPKARPSRVEAYSIDHLVTDVFDFADALTAPRFHLVGHDWGALVAWHAAALHPERLYSLTALSTPHPDALLHAIQNDADQRRRSHYLEFFRMRDGSTEKHFAEDDWMFLRRIYQGKVPEEEVMENVRRLAEPGAITAALNWYRAMDSRMRIGTISVPTLFIWGTEDLAAGEAAARATRALVDASYEFVPLEGKTHWLMAEDAAGIADRLLEHFHSAPEQTRTTLPLSLAAHS